MKMFSLQTPALAAAAFLMGSGLVVVPAYADDTTIAEAVQTLTNAVTAADSTAAVAGTDDAAQEAASDTAAGLPKFNNRQHRREYLEKLRQENPDKFKEMMKKRQEHWLANHPKAAERIKERKEWEAAHPGEKRRDYRENRRDRKEDKRDRREDRWDANHGADRGRPGPGIGPRPHGYQHPGQGVANGQGKYAKKAYRAAKANR